MRKFEWLLTLFIWTLFFLLMGFCLTKFPEPEKTGATIIFGLLFVVFGVFGRLAYQQDDVN